MKKEIMIIVTVLVAVIMAGMGFFAGMKYQESKRPTGFGNFAGQRQGQIAGNRNGNNFRPVNGEIIAVDDKTITVKLADGSSKIIMLASLVTKQDLKVGVNVAIFGQTNSDGSVVAQTIQIGSGSGILKP